MIVVIDYGMGNLRSVSKALEFLGAEVVVSGKEEDIAAADKIVLPGVGAYNDGMKNLRSRGLVEILNREALVRKKPLLGICLGMQLMAGEGFERGRTQGLGWFRGSVRLLELDSFGLKVPHVGWNDISVKGGERIFQGLDKEKAFYFVHSYRMVCENPEDVIATCNYGVDFTAAVRRGNIIGTQFHPEKSQENGLKVLENFIGWDGKG